MYEGAKYFTHTVVIFITMSWSSYYCVVRMKTEVQRLNGVFKLIHHSSRFKSRSF